MTAHADITVAKVSSVG